MVCPIFVTKEKLLWDKRHFRKCRLSHICAENRSGDIVICRFSEMERDFGLGLYIGQNRFIYNGGCLYIYSKYNIHKEPADYLNLTF